MQDFYLFSYLLRKVFARKLDKLCTQIRLLHKNLTLSKRSIYFKNSENTWYQDFVTTYPYRQRQVCCTALLIQSWIYTLENYTKTQIISAEVFLVGHCVILWFFLCHFRQCVNWFRKCLRFLMNTCQNLHKSFSWWLIIASLWLISTNK